MKHQHRWTSEEEILKEIERCHTASHQLFAASVQLEEQIKREVAEINLLECSRRKEDKHKANALVIEVEKQWKEITMNCKRATGLLDRKLPELKRAPAAFNTIPMEAITGKDIAVV